MRTKSLSPDFQVLGPQGRPRRPSRLAKLSLKTATKRSRSRLDPWRTESPKLDPLIYSVRPQRKWNQDHDGAGPSRLGPKSGQSQALKLARPDLETGQADLEGWPRNPLDRTTILFQSLNDLAWGSYIAETGPQLARSDPVGNKDHLNWDRKPERPSSWCRPNRTSGSANQPVLPDDLGLLPRDSVHLSTSELPLSRWKSPR